MNIMLKRVYETPSHGDGLRVLVDRLWPRGVKKDDGRFDVWLKEGAPSTELRQWFAHDPEKWPEFVRRYRSELKLNPALGELQKLARAGDVTLVYGARDPAHNQAQVLKQVLETLH
jgi:uncharacterized protein YeaO (DUF488 family)